MAIGDIAGKGGASAEFCGFVRGFEIEIQTHDIETIAGKAKCIGTPETLSCTGDHCDSHRTPIGTALALVASCSQSDCVIWELHLGEVDR